MAETVKVPTFSGKAADFPVFRTKFTAYADALGLGGVLDCEDDVTTAQQKRLYSLLVLALPEAALHVIRKVERKSATAGNDAWEALLHRYEHDGIHRRGDLLNALDEKQRPEETCMDFFNRLVDLQAQLGRVDEEVPDRRLVMNIIRGLRPEYAAMTDTINERDSAVTVEFMETLLATTGQRIERRLGEQREPKPAATAFPASGEEPEDLRSMMQKLKQEVAALTTSRRRNGGGSEFKGACWHCGESGHRRKDCPKKTTPSANAADLEDSKAVAFPSVALSGTGSKVASLVQGEVETWMWLVDSGASHHMTSVREDFVEFRPIPQQWVKGISAYATGMGSVRLTMRAEDGQVVPAMLYDVYFVPDLAARAMSSHHRLFSVTQARQRGHRMVFEDPCDVLCVHERHGGGIRVPLRRDFGLVWLAAGMTTRGADVSACPAAAPPSKPLWHLRLGHLSESCMDRMRRAGATGLTFDASERLCFCESCAVCKSRVKAIPREPCADPERVFQQVGVDFCGPMTVPALGGGRYSFLVTDFKSRMLLHDVLRTKDEAPRSFRGVLDAVRKLGHRVEHVRLDNDSVLLGTDFMTVLQEHDITHDLIAPYSHWQHGRVERQWGTLVPMALAMLHTAGLEKCFWGLAMNAAVHVRNRSWSEAAGGPPLEIVTKCPVDLSRLRVFGCPAYVHIDKSRRRKLDDRAWRGIFVGYATDSPVWLVYNPRTRRVERSRNVDFDEMALMGSVSVGEKAPSAKDDDGVPVFFEEPVERSGGDTASGEPTSPSSASGEPSQAVQESGEPSQPAVELRRSSRARQPPTEWWISQPAVNLAAAAGAVPHQEPASYKQALRSPQAEQWKAAMETEYDALTSRKTWRLVPRPAGRKLVDSKWVFKLKRNPDGSIARYKARLVARGFTQEHGVDYQETFAPTVKVAAIRIILALAAHFDWDVEQMDVVTAFLEADIAEDIYMRQPEGYRQVDQHGEELVCKVLKSIYGLKQAPRNWNKTVSAWLVEYGFKQSTVDPCIYTFAAAGDLYILALYVDDSIMAGPPGSFISDFKRAFGKRFNVQDLGPVSWLLGMTVERDRAAGVLKVGQRQYILDMLERFNMSDCKPVSTPMTVGALSEATASEVLSPDVPYQSLIGSLLYASVSTRPDITMAVSHLSRYMARPSTVHWEQAKRVLRYLQGTLDWQLVYGAGESTATLTGYSDADFAGDADGRRSRTAFVFLLNGAAVSWKSQRQPTVALSTAEAEYMALTAATQEAVFLRQLLQEMGQPPASGTLIHEDNQSCIALCKNTMTTGRSKHIEVKMHFCREKQESGEIVVDYCPTEEMLADGLSKPLAGERHKKLFRSVMGSSE